jgi:ABC-2 type transport system permease protein
MIRLFLTFELQKIASYFRTGKAAKFITGILFILVFGFVGVGLYYFFLSGFRFVNFSVEQEIQAPLTLFIYEVFLLVMAGVVVFSALVSGIFSLFRGGYDAWIISSPSYKVFPKIILIKSILTSSWPLFVMFLPAVLAFDTVYHLHTLVLICILVSVVILLVLLNAISLLSILLLSSLYYKITQKSKKIRFSFGGLVTLFSVVIIAIISNVWSAVSTVDLVKLFKADNIDVNVSIQTISSHFTLLPTHPLALQILNWQNKHTSEALLSFSYLCVITFTAVLVWWKISYLFYPLWQKFQEGSTKLSEKEMTSKSTRVTYYFTGSKTMALFKKEALVFRRNVKGILWFLFLLGLWLAQVGTNIILHHNIVRYQTDVSEKLAVFQALQFIIAVYFICSFALRFVFPSFSVEKKTAWIVGSAPLSFIRIFFSKYLFYIAFFVTMGTLMSYINFVILNLTYTYGFYSMTLFISTVIFIVTLGLCLGALFPSTDSDDPEMISTSMSGLFFTALSLIYGALSAGVLYLTLTKGLVSLLFIFIALTYIMVGILLLHVPFSVSKRSL